VTAAAAVPESIAAPRRLRRALPWALLLLLLGVAQTLLLVLTVRYEATLAQDETELVVAELASEVRGGLLLAEQQLQALGWGPGPVNAWRAPAAELLKTRRELRRLERRDTGQNVVEVQDSPYLPRLFTQWPRSALGLEAEVACGVARRAAAPMFSRTYFVPTASGLGSEVVDLCVPVQSAGRPLGFVVGTFALTPLLEGALAVRPARRHEISFVEGDGSRLARAGASRGASTYRAERVVDLPGAQLLLRADSSSAAPSLIPNLATALVLGLSLALFAVVLLLARDVRRRARAEDALAEALAFRQAMENSLVTGLRARDLAGAIRYVNPAFCSMVGYSVDELTAAVPPYWPPEHLQAYQSRHAARMQGLAAMARDPTEAREGFETVFMRKDGERFPVMVYEAPLVDGQGRHTGWMSAVVDLSTQRRVEDISRQQLDRLQATARLATVGEMASLLSHELNQPLAAIASYASGGVNLLAVPESERDADAPGLLRHALERIAEQAERAGRVIKSVHDFVRRREQQHESLAAAMLIESVLPLARLQARKSGTRIELDLPPAGTPPLRVRCDRTMLEQVLLNLARNGIQAMETATPLPERVLTLGLRPAPPGRVAFSVTDAGAGVSAEIAGKLFTPFFTTRAEGMGLGLSLCRTVIEQHGGALEFGPGPLGVGTEFRFTLAAPKQAQSGETAAPAATPLIP
jgi:two-component system, LuxR family, sensor histidine kinase DctS